MNKKLLTLAVAAVVAAPSAAMAEAVLYGKLHQSIDYVDITNAQLGVADTVIGYGYNGVVDQTITLTNTVYGPYGFPVTGQVSPQTATFVDRNGNLQGTPSVAFNNSSVPVGVTYVDAAGVGREVVLQPGQSFTVTDTVNANFQVQGNQIPVNAVQLIRVDANGNPLLRPGPVNAPQDFTGWGVSAKNWRNYTTVNPLTGIAGRVNDRANRLGVKGSEDLGNGLKAVYQVEFGLDINGGGGDAVTFRNSFVGVASDFGTLLVGRHDTPLKISTGKLDLFSDTMADYNGTVGFDDRRTDKTVAYISPSFSGVSFMAASIAAGGDGAGNANVNNDSFASAYSLALIYNNGPFYASAAYESLGNEWFMNSATSTAGSAGCLNAITGDRAPNCAYVDDDFTKWRLGLGLLDWNGFTLTGIYEQQDNLPAGQQWATVGYIDPNGNVSIVEQSGVTEQRLWQIQAGYSFGNNMFKAMYGAVDRDADRPFNRTRNTLSLNNIRDDLEGDRETWAVGFDHNFSKRTKVYALYTDVTDDLSDNILVQGAEWNGFSMGLVHSF